MKRLFSIFVLLVVFCAPLGAAHRLENKTTAIVNAPDQPAIRYADLLRIVASAPARDGLTFDVQRKRLRILDACDAAKDAPAIVLEDADYDYAVQLAIAHPWGAVHRDLVAFTDDLKAAPKVEAEKK